MIVREGEIVAITAAVQARDRAALAAAGAQVGLALELETLEALAALAAPCRLELRAAVGAMLTAASSEVGIALEEVPDFRRLPYTRSVCLAVRHAGRVTIGVRSIVSSLGNAWPSLRPWYKQLAKNRERAEAWAETIADDRVSISCTSPPDPAASRPSASEAALMAQLVEQPDDLTARLVLADLLMERDDVRGELLRLDAAMRALPRHAPERKAFSEQMGVLVKQHGRQLAGEIAELVPEYEIEGGFVDRVTMSATAFARHGERIFRLQPVRKLTLEPSSPAAIEKLARQPHLALVRELSLGGPVTSAVRVSLAPLAGARADRLEGLELWYVGLGLEGDPAFTALAAPRLRRLRICGDLSAGAVRELVCNRALCDRLEELVMFARVQGGTGLADGTDLADGIDLPNATCFEVRFTSFLTDEVLAPLVARMPRLEVFEAWLAGPATYRALAARRTLRQLCIAGPVDPNLLAELIDLPRLEQLDLSHLRLEPSDVEPLVRALDALPPDRPLRRIRCARPWASLLPPRYEIYR